MSVEVRRWQFGGKELPIKHKDVAAIMRHPNMLMKVPRCPGTYAAPSESSTYSRMLILVLLLNVTGNELSNPKKGTEVTKWPLFPFSRV